MNTIDEINIGMSSRTKDHRIASCVSCSSVRSQIARAEIRFYFNDAARKLLTSITADNEFAQQFTRNETRIAIKEGAAQQLGIADHTGRDWT